MRVKALTGNETLPPIGGVYAVGNFDGVHLGHRRLFEVCAEISCGAPVAAFTFDGLSKGSDALYTRDEKDELLFAAGAEYTVTEDFEAVRGMSPREFIDGYLVKNLHPSAVVCGEDFRFGCGGAGNAETLRDLLAPHGVTVYVAPTVCVGGEAVSTTRIKRCLADAHPDEAALLLGRPHFITYEVMHGAHLGTGMGFPTANGVIGAGVFVPAKGVYAGTLERGGECFPCVCNVGVRPTVSTDGRVTVETHAPGVSGELYGETVRVSLERFLRPERKFGNLDDLFAQISRDIEEIYKK